MAVADFDQFQDRKGVVYKAIDIFIISELEARAHRHHASGSTGPLFRPQSMLY
jgi:hypothetical protein